MDMRFDRAAEDLGNVVGLEHVNVQIPDQQLSTLYHIAGLGLTRDPYMMASVTNMWVNIGRSQFHLPTGEAQVLRGRVGLVLPDLEALRRRLDAVQKPLEGTQFEFAPANDCVDTVSPWGNRIRCHRPDEARFGRVMLGMPYVEFDVRPGAAAGIARFYDEILGAPTRLDDGGEAPAARVLVGMDQELVFQETDAPEADYDGHHIQVYIANFSGPHRRLAERGLITEESNQHQYRFTDIVDPDGGEVLFVLEHEVRSMTHPLYARPLVNRDPGSNNVNYAPGYENQPWAMPRVQ